MPGLVDIVALRETITIREASITVRGLSITTIGRCLAESDELAKFWAQRKFDGLSLLSTLPITVSRIVATSIIDEPPQSEPASMAGFGEVEVVQTLEKEKRSREHMISMNMLAFDELNADDQLTLVEAVIRVSFPGGISPFAARVRKLAGLEEKPGGSLFARFGKGPDGSSPQGSTNLSADMDTSAPT